MSQQDSVEIRHAYRRSVNALLDVLDDPATTGDDEKAAMKAYREATAAYNNDALDDLVKRTALFNSIGEQLKSLRNSIMNRAAPRTLVSLGEAADAIAKVLDKD